MKIYTFLIFFVLVIFMLGVGCTGSNSEKISSQASLQQPTEAAYQNSEWASDVSNSGTIFVNDTDQISSEMENKDYYTVSSDLEKYKRDIETEIKTTDNFKVSPDLQGCKDEYRLALLNDYNAATFMKSGINQLTSGNLGTSVTTIDFGTEELRLANSHYDNMTLLMNAYNNAHPDSQLELKFMRHNVAPKNTQQSTASATIETPTPSKVKTLADKEPDTSTNNVDASENTQSIASSTQNIFDYCTWQAQLTKKIGEYNKAPEGKNYVVVAVKINNTGDQTFSTNPGYWHLKIGDMYYQHDSSTYDNSLNHLTTDIGPGGKITTKIAYLVDGEPSISDMNMYYDGPGSDGTIHS